jgi:hypothetical protein
VADGSTVYHMGGGWWKKTDPTNGTVFYVNKCTGECTRDEPDIPSSSDGEGDSDSGQDSPADARLMMLDRHCVGRPHQQMLRLQELR